MDVLGGGGGYNDRGNDSPHGRNRGGGGYGRRGGYNDNQQTPSYANFSTRNRRDDDREERRGMGASHEEFKQPTPGMEYAIIPSTIFRRNLQVYTYFSLHLNF